MIVRVRVRASMRACVRVCWVWIVDYKINSNEDAKIE